MRNESKIQEESVPGQTKKPTSIWCSLSIFSCFYGLRKWTQRIKQQWSKCSRCFSSTPSYDELPLVITVIDEYNTNDSLKIGFGMFSNFWCAKKKKKKKKKKEYKDCISAEGKTSLLHNKCPGYDIKQSDGEFPGMQSTPSLPLLPGPLWPGVVASDKVLSMGQIKVFDI